MGHGLNSMLCDNRLQHLFGARGPLDIVELPSHVLERVSRSPAVVQAAFNADRASLASNMARRNANSNNSNEATSQEDGVAKTSVEAQALTQKMCEAVELRSHFCRSMRQLASLVMPRLDCALHGNNAPDSVRALRTQVHSITEEVLRCEVPPETYAWLSLNHLVTYAGMCHAYPYAEAIAERVWQDHLKRDARNPEAGRVLMEAIFRPGGALNAEQALQKLGGGMLEASHGGFSPVLQE